MNDEEDDVEAASPDKEGEEAGDKENSAIGGIVGGADLLRSLGLLSTPRTVIGGPGSPTSSVVVPLRAPLWEQFGSLHNVASRQRAQARKQRRLEAAKLKHLPSADVDAAEVEADALVQPAGEAPPPPAERRMICSPTACWLRSRMRTRTTTGATFLTMTTTTSSRTRWPTSSRWARRARRERLVVAAGSEERRRRRMRICAERMWSRASRRLRATTTIMSSTAASPSGMQIKPLLDNEARRDEFDIVEYAERLLANFDGGDGPAPGKKSKVGADGLAGSAEASRSSPTVPTVMRLRGCSWRRSS